jgi:hypothetical protein
MKVTFTCEKCGHELFTSDVVGGRKGALMYDIDPCPNCAKLTYGPLTEDMLAEALARAAGIDNVLKGGEVWGEFLREARFVLRLLRECEVLNESRRLTNLFPMMSDATDVVAAIYGKTPRDWLFDLARKSS